MNNDELQVMIDQIKRDFSPMYGWSAEQMRTLALLEIARRLQPRHDPFEAKDRASNDT